MSQTFPTPRKILDRNRVAHCKKPSSDASPEERHTYAKDRRARKAKDRRARKAKDRRARKAKDRATFVPDQRAINAARHSLIHHDHKPKKVRAW